MFYYKLFLIFDFRPYFSSIWKFYYFQTSWTYSFPMQMAAEHHTNIRLLAGVFHNHDCVLHCFFYFPFKF